jgi:ribosomal protein S18 acetylase RimI-like enzyme
MIRRAVPADIPRLKQIRASVRENLLSPGRVSDQDYAWFVEHGPVWVWDGGAAILGFSAGDPRHGSIWALFVHPDCEGRGIGTALLARACESLSAAGHRTATLETAPRTRAAGFYLRQGWIAGGLDAVGDLAFSRVLGPPQDR